MSIKSILAVTDLSLDASHAVERAAMYAVEHRALLNLLYAAAPGDPNCSDAVGRLAQLAKLVAQRFGVTVQTANRTGDTLEQIVEAARCNDLIVISHRRERSLSAFIYGTRFERLMRLSRCPVLVTKLKPRKRYRRILVAVDFTDTSKALVNLALDVDPDSEIELFHAINTIDETKLRSADVSYQAIKAYRHRTRLEAQDRMFWLTDSFGARKGRVMSAIGQGDPARQAAAQQEYVGADLIVVGKRRRSALAEFFCASVAQRLFSWSSSDVLVVPHYDLSSTRAAAKLRIEPEQGNAQGAILSNSGRAL
jgi:nucleotide-binding universal stress UspA family protein